MMKSIDSAENLAAAREARDPTHPGAYLSRKKSLRLVEEHGSAPVIWNSWVNRGEEGR